MAVIDIVAQDQHGGAAGHELGADHIGLSQTLGLGLLGIGEADAPLLACAQKLREARQVVRSGDDQDVAYPRQHQGSERVVDHRLVIDRQKLLRRDVGHGVKPRPASARQDDAFQVCPLSWIMEWAFDRPRGPITPVGSRREMSRISTGFENLAGAPGFEPGNGGTKNRCLTSWRRPNGGVYIIGTGDAGNRFRTIEDILKDSSISPLAAIPPRRYKPASR